MNVRLGRAGDDGCSSYGTVGDAAAETEGAKGVGHREGRGLWIVFGSDGEEGVDCVRSSGWREGRRLLASTTCLFLYTLPLSFFDIEGWRP